MQNQYQIIELRRICYENYNGIGGRFDLSESSRIQYFINSSDSGIKFAKKNLYAECRELGWTQEVGTHCRNHHETLQNAQMPIINMKSSSDDGTSSDIM